ncbi:LysR family transcriptional regulator [Francisella halioticida]|uniref:LysR family transcriptional regulator n=1 Tax=Francisella halioticida TaxID=549298 RepID=UPI001B805EB9|nr:LysR family transcriptional regulator [Francisella halioticida]
MINLKLSQLRYFVLIVESGGFRAAVKKANRSQAALSSSIKELELIIGQKLFEPSYKAKLTSFGEDILPNIKRFLGNYYDFNAELQSLANGEVGKLKIGSVPSVAAKFIPQIISEFAHEYPEVEIVLIDQDAKKVEEKLLTEKVDLSLGNKLQIENENIGFTYLFSDPVGVVCSVKNPLSKNKKGVGLDQLLNYPFIRNGTCVLLEGSEINTLAKNATYSVENITALYSFLEHNIGVTTLPKLAFSNKNTDLVWLPLKSSNIYRDIGLSYLTNKTLPPIVKAFYDLCIKSSASFPASNSF